MHHNGTIKKMFDLHSMQKKKTFYIMFIATVLDTAGWNRLKELPELFNRFQPSVQCSL